MYDLIVKNATVATSLGQFAADVAVANGKIAALGRALGPAAAEVDATGLHLLPGLIDIHVHLRDPGTTYKEDFASGTLAAAAGGVTTVFDMPNTRPAVSTAETLRQKREIVSPKAHVDFGLYGVILQDNEDDLAGLAEEGAIGFKLFMGETTGNNPCPTDDAIFGALRRIGRLGLHVNVHAENNPVLQRLKTELKATGRTDSRAHLESRPAFVEAEAIGRVIAIAEGANCPVHIVHVSSRPGLETVAWAKSRGVRVTCEALIAHLFLDDSVYERCGNLAQINPPIREREHLEALWAGVLDGRVDCIATDHAPHSEEEQARENVWEGVGGFIGVEVMLPLLLTRVAEGRLSLEQMVRLTSESPARLYGLYPRKGSLAVGSDADFVLVDLKRRYILDRHQLHSKHPVSPFEGWPVVGRPVATFLRGDAVLREGDVVGTPRGQMLRPNTGELG